MNIIQVYLQYRGIARTTAGDDLARFRGFMQPWAECDKMYGPIFQMDMTDLLEQDVFFAYRVALEDVQGNLGMGAMKAKADSGIDFSEPIRMAYHNLICDRHTVICPDCGKRIDVEKCGKPAAVKDRRDMNK